LFNKKRKEKMKKVIFALVLVAAFTACNNGTTSSEVAVDSTKTDSTKVAVDSTTVDSTSVK